MQQIEITEHDFDARIFFTVDRSASTYTICSVSSAFVRTFPCASTTIDSPEKCISSSAPTRLHIAGITLF